MPFPLLSVCLSVCLCTRAAKTYMQNGFNVFMSNADGEGASVPEADVD